MSSENRVGIDYGKDQGFKWTNKSMSINVPGGKPHPQIANILLATSLIFGGYQLAKPERASALQDYSSDTAPALVSAQTDGAQLQCEPIIDNGLGTTGEIIPAELQGRPTCFNPDGSSDSVIFWCDQVLNPNHPLANLDIDANPLCLEGVNDVNGNGVLGDYNPITLDVNRINGLQVSDETSPTAAAATRTSIPPTPAPVPEPSPAEAISVLAVTTLFLLFGGRLNARRNYEAGIEDGATHGSQTDQDAESYAKKATGKDFKEAKEYYLRTHGVGKPLPFFKRHFRRK